jgi:hypothetical protein
MTRKYSSTSVETTLSAGLSSTATTMTVASGTAASLLGNQSLAAGNVDQFTLAIDPDTVNEEIVFVTDVTSDTLTVVRARAGTSGIAHSGGATVKHVLTSNDLDFFATGAAAGSAISTSAVTLTGAQTIAGVKTFSSAPVFTAITNTGTLTLPTSTDTLVGRATTDTLSAKTLSSPKEITTVSATAATGTVNFDALTQGVLYYTTNASANWTLNVRGSSSVSLNTMMATGDSVTIAFAVTQGATAYFQSEVTIDGTSVTPKWQGAIVPSAGNASSIDVYTLTIIKTASATFTVLGSQTRFA